MIVRIGSRLRLCFDTMKAVILARVSTEEQKDAGNSLPAQIARLEAYCKRKGFEIVETYSFDESAYKTKRDEFDRILDFLKEKTEKIAVCFDKVDRLSRNVFDKRVSLLYEKAVADEIELHFVSDSQVISSSMSAGQKTQFGMNLVMAKYYSDAISDNVRRVFELKRRNGEWPGPPPLGYRSVTNEVGRRDMIPDFERAHLIKKMFELYSTNGYSISSLQEKMKELGLKSKDGKTVSRSLIDWMLKNPFYCGIARPRSSAPYNHRYAPLVSKDLFDRCQFIVSGRNKTRSKETSKDFVLKGIVHCKKCGCLYSPEIKRKKSGLTFTYYSCTNGKGICKRDYVPEDVLLKPVYDAFGDFESISEETQLKLVEKLRQLNEFEVEYHAKEIKRIRAEYDRIQKRSEVLMDIRLDLSITKDDYDKKLQELKDAQYRLNLELDEHTKADHEYHIHLSTVLNLSRRVKQIFDSSEVNEKRALIKFLLQNPLAEGKKLHFQLRKPFDTVLQLAHRPTVLRAAQELRTVILSGYKSYEMDAAVKMLRGEEPFTEEAMRWMETAKH